MSLDNTNITDNTITSKDRKINKNKLIKPKKRWKWIVAPFIALILIIACLFDLIFSALGYAKAQEVALQMIYVERQTIQEKLLEYQSVIEPIINEIFENGITTGQNIRIPLDISQGGNAVGDTTGSIILGNVGSKELPGVGAVYNAYQQVWKDFCKRRDESNGKYGEFAFEYNEITETFWEQSDWTDNLAIIVQNLFPEQEIRDIYAPIGTNDGYTSKNPAEIFARNFGLFITGYDWGYIVGGEPTEKTVDVSEEEKREYYIYCGPYGYNPPNIESDTFSGQEMAIDKNKKYYIDELSILGGNSNDDEITKNKRKTDWINYFEQTKAGLASYGYVKCFELKEELVDATKSEAVLSYTVGFNADTQTAWNDILKEIEDSEFKKIQSEQDFQMALEMIRFLANVNNPAVSTTEPVATLDGTMFMMPSKEQFESVSKAFNEKFSWRDYVILKRGTGSDGTGLGDRSTAGLVSLYEMLTEQMGFTKEAACSVLGVAKSVTNFECENVSASGGYGIFDWHGAELNTLKNYADYETCDTQLRFFYNDFLRNNKYYSLREKLPSSTDINECVELFQEHYMSDSIYSKYNAINNAQKYMDIIDNVSNLKERTSAFYHLTQDEIDAYMFAANASGKTAEAINYALCQVGQPYSMPRRNRENRIFDCGSLCLWAYMEAGMNASELTTNCPGTAAESWRFFKTNGKSVSWDNMQAGDLVYYSYTTNGRYDNVSHVQMYIGNGLCVSADGDNLGVIIKPCKKDGLVGVARPTM